MSKPVILENLTIVCDACGFKKTLDIDSLTDWHGKACPDCHAPNIIDDKDIAIHNGMVALAELVNSMVTHNPDSPVLRVNVKSAEIKDLIQEHKQ